MKKKINPKSSALILIEMQNDFLSPKGKLNHLVADVVEKTDIIKNANRAINLARKKGIPIYWIPIQFSNGHQEIGSNPKGILKIVKDNDAFVRESWGAKIHEEMEYSKNDLVINGKSSICAFSGTNLDHILRNNQIDTILLGGFLSHVCVTSTMVSAYDKGYDVITLTDSVATAGQEAQDKVIEHIYPMFSTPKTVDSLNDIL